MMRGKKLSDYLGKNEKTKGIVKLQKAGSGAPQREPVMSEDDQKAMMLHAYRRQEELKVRRLFIKCMQAYFKLIIKGCANIFIFKHDQLFKNKKIKAFNWGFRIIVR